MTSLKTKKIRQMANKEMDDKLQELYLELSKERAGSEIGTAKNTSKIRNLKRTIARILTVKRQTELK